MQVVACRDNTDGVESRGFRQGKIDVQGNSSPFWKPNQTGGERAWPAKDIPSLGGANNAETLSLAKWWRRGRAARPVRRSIPEGLYACRMTEKGIVVEVIQKTTAWASWGVPRFRERKQPTLTEVSWASAWQWERPAAFPATLVEVRRRERGQTKKRCRLGRRMVHENPQLDAHPSGIGIPVESSSPPKGKITEGFSACRPGGRVA